MKKILKISLFFLLCYFIGIHSVFASTNTNVRTEENNYLVNDWVLITEDNKQNILTTPAVDASEKVYDFADLYSSSEEERLYREINDYIEHCGMDMAVVTINSNSKTPRDYADDFYDYNSFGIGSDRDGVLFLVDMDNREIYMSTTGNAIDIYTDQKIDYIMDKIFTFFSDQEYYEGTSNFIQMVDEYYSRNLTSYESNSLHKDMGKIFLYSLLGGFIASGIVIWILVCKNKLVRKATTAREYLIKDSMVATKTKDKFVGSHVVKHRIEHSSSDGGGFGGSSSHSSSSGSSHGGGGHKF